MSHTQSNIQFFPGKQEIKPRSECPDDFEEKSMKYYMSEEELQEFPVRKPIRRIWIGSGEDGHLGVEMGDLNG